MFGCDHFMWLQQPVVVPQCQSDDLTRTWAAHPGCQHGWFGRSCCSVRSRIDSDRRRATAVFRLEANGRCHHGSVTRCPRLGYPCGLAIVDIVMACVSRCTGLRAYLTAGAIIRLEQTRPTVSLGIANSWRTVTTPRHRDVIGDGRFGQSDVHGHRQQCIDPCGYTL
jgi:hypothetical protein